MPWPISQDYNEAVQHPASSFADAELKQGEAATNALGIPMPRSGNFADVYEFTCPERKWAVKCFTRQIPGLRERYKEVSTYLKETPLPFMVEFTYLDQGIRVQNEWYPILKMHWVEGLTLNQFLKDNADKPQYLEVLCQIWTKLAARLREVGIAHGDLQHGNVLLVPSTKANALAIKLVDYDGMCVPALTMLKSIEVGHPNFQHPQRAKEHIYGLEVDRFSHLVIYTALRALLVGGKPLWEKYDNGDNLLFKASDFAKPNESPLFKELLGFADPAVRILAEKTAGALGQPLKETPPLAEVLTRLPGKRKTVASSSSRTDIRKSKVQVPAGRRGGRGLMVGLVAAGLFAVLAVGGLAAFFLMNQTEEPKPEPVVAKKTDNPAKQPPPKKKTAEKKLPELPKDGTKKKLPKEEPKNDPGKEGTVDITPAEPKAEPGPVQWIWFDEGDPVKEAPAGTRFFRKTFELDKVPEHAQLTITADNRFTAWINGTKVGASRVSLASNGVDQSWKNVVAFNITGALRPGKNVLAVEAINTELSPAGVLARIRQVRSGDTQVVLVTDGSWKVSQEGATGWNAVDFNDKRWTGAKVLGPIGIGDWGNLAFDAATLPQWVWFDEADPTVDAPAGSRHFRQTFQLTTVPQQATLYITADNSFTLWINGTKVGSGDEWMKASSFEVAKLLRAGKNVLAVTATNTDKSPAGLIVRLRYGKAGQAKVDLVTDFSWKVSKEAPAGWESTDFDDGEWPAVRVLGPIGTNPWGQIAELKEFKEP
jgi:hypothetical protein